MEQTQSPRQLTAFQGQICITNGPAPDVALHLRRMSDQDEQFSYLCFDDANGNFVDLDLSGTDADIKARVTPAPIKPKVGRPKLGVISKEVTLLPRHWDWLKTQKGGASATLRRLVEEASRAPDTKTVRRHAAAAADRFMMATLGEETGYENAARALYAGEKDTFFTQTAHWPADLRDYTYQLAEMAFTPDTPHGLARREG